jgi:hypothetical protein
MAVPPLPFVTVAQAKSALGIPVHDTIDDDWITLCVSAVNTFVSQTRSDLTDIDDDRVRWGAVQLVTRWYARRNSTDVSAFTEMGGPPPSVDRDIAIALQINYNFGPVAI